MPGCFPAALDGTPAFKSLDVRAVWTSRLRELVADYAQWNLRSLQDLFGPAEKTNRGDQGRDNQGSLVDIIATEPSLRFGGGAPTVRTDERRPWWAIQRWAAGARAK